MPPEVKIGSLWFWKVSFSMFWFFFHFQKDFFDSIERRIGPILKPLREVLKRLKYNTRGAWRGAQLRGDNTDLLVDEIEDFVKAMSVKEAQAIGLQVSGSMLEFKLPVYMRNIITAIDGESSNIDWDRETKAVRTNLADDENPPKRQRKIPSNRASIDFDQEWTDRLDECCSGFDELNFKPAVHEITSRDSADENCLKWNVLCPVIGCEHQIPICVSFQPTPNFRRQSYKNHLAKHVRNSIKVISHATLLLSVC